MPEATRFGKYLLFERIAVGGMAEVFRAKPVGSDSLLALKRIHPHHLENDDFVSMLIDEAKISVQLNHPNVVQVTDLGRVDKHYFIAMEFIAGRDLRRVIERLAESGRPFPVDHAVAIIAGVARGLDYAHAMTDPRGKKMEIIHRDISPQNVLVGFDGVVKVIDFGIAKAAGRLMETQVGILKGKYAYMSPEQAAGGTLDHRTDIFSTGIMLYEAAVGKHPFRATHDIETLRNIKNSAMTQPREANPAISAAVEKVMLQALASRKEDRYFTAGAMADELEKALEEIHPGYDLNSLSEFISDLFADEMAAGFPDITAPPPGQPQSIPSQPGLISGSFRLDRLSSTNNTVAVSQTHRANGSKARPAEPVSTHQQGSAMVATGGGFQAIWMGTRNAVTSFMARIQAGKLTSMDTAMVGALSVVIVGLALLLVWEPSGPAPAATPIALSSLRATPLALATASPHAAVTPPVVGAMLPVASDPPGAQVQVEGHMVGVTPFSVRGLRTDLPSHVTISKNGFITWNGTGLPGRDHIDVVLKPVPRGTVEVTSIPQGAVVRVDGIKQGSTPLTLQLPVGDHELFVELSGRGEPKGIHVDADKLTKVAFKLQ